MFKKKKKDVVVLITFRCAPEDEAEYRAEVDKAKKLLLTWFPKNLTVEVNQGAWNQFLSQSKVTEGGCLELFVNVNVPLLCNSWMKEGFLTAVSPKKHDFIKSVIEGAMIDKMPEELAMYKKQLKKAHEILDQQAMDEANEHGRKAGQAKREEEERIRKEKAEKLKAEKERIANEEAATVAAEKAPKAKAKTGAKSKAKAKMKAKATHENDGKPKTATAQYSSKDAGSTVHGPGDETGIASHGLPEVGQTPTTQHTSALEVKPESLEGTSHHAQTDSKPETPIADVPIHAEHEPEVEPSCDNEEKRNQHSPQTEQEHSSDVINQHSPKAGEEKHEIDVMPIVQQRHAQPTRSKEDSHAALGSHLFSFTCCRFPKKLQDDAGDFPTIAEAKDGFTVGERVLKRDAGDDWTFGYVTHLEPLQVTFSDAPYDARTSNTFTWDEVRRFEAILFLRLEPCKEVGRRSMTVWTPTGLSVRIDEFTSAATVVCHIVYRTTFLPEAIDELACAELNEYESFACL